MSKIITKEELEKTVKLSSQGATVQSDKIAKVFGKEHSSVLKMIEKHKVSLVEMDESDYSISKYFIEADYINSRGKEYKRYQLTRKGFDLVVLSFTGKEAFKYKIWYIDEFHKKSEVIKEHKIVAYENNENPIWLEFRKEGKEIRTKFTDVINEYLLPQRIAENKETNQFVSRYITSYTNLIYKKLNIIVPTGLKLNRDSMSLRTLFEIEKLEEEIRFWISTYGIEGIHYKEIYQIIKKKLL